MDNTNQNSEIAVDENQMMDKEPKKFKWWILLIIVGVVILLFFAFIIILLGLLIVGFVIFGARSVPNTQPALNYSISAPSTPGSSVFDADEDDSTSAPLPSSANEYDYTIVYDAYGLDKTEVESWITKYYPNCTITKDPNDGMEYWKLTSDLPLKDISIDGYIFTYDYICIDFDENDCVKRVGFFRSSTDRDEFDTVRQELSALYGLESMSNMWNSDMSDEFSLEFYIWEAFDGKSDLYICRTYGDTNPKPEIGLTITERK